MATPKQTDPQFKLRLTPELKSSIETAASENNRSMPAEIVARLEASVADDAMIQSLVRGDKYGEQIASYYKSLAEENDLLRRRGIAAQKLALQLVLMIQRAADGNSKLLEEEIERARHGDTLKKYQSISSILLED